MKHVKLEIGQGRRGPDYFGCCNTGLAPAIMRSKLFTTYPQMAHGYAYAVGPEAYLTDAVTEFMLGKVRGSTWKHGSKVVRLFKTAGAAWKHFDALCDKVQRSNDEDIRAVNDLTAKANAGDMAAALRLGDYL